MAKQESDLWRRGQDDTFGRVVCWLFIRQKTWLEKVGCWNSLFREHGVCSIHANFWKHEGHLRWLVASFLIGSLRFHSRLSSVMKGQCPSDVRVKRKCLGTLPLLLQVKQPKKYLPLFYTSSSPKVRGVFQKPPKKAGAWEETIAQLQKDRKTAAELRCARGELEWLVGFGWFWLVSWLVGWLVGWGLFFAASPTGGRASEGFLSVACLVGGWRAFFGNFHPQNQLFVDV